MTRRDLSPDYNGWQVLDPTPQDKQSGHYRIGPVPVQAVKHKKVALDCVCCMNIVILCC